MGSKMSFSRGSSDQHTVSEFTSVTPQPRSSIHASSDCKQLPDGMRCSEEDLDSKRRDEIITTELNQPPLRSDSCGRLESVGCLTSETVGGTNCLQSEHTSSQEGMEPKPKVTADTRPALASRRRGRPRKVKSPKVKNDTAGPDALQHKEVSQTIALPLENHTSVDLPNVFDNQLINEISGPLAVSDDRLEDDASLLPKKRRGRPRKAEIAALQNTLPVAATASPPHVNNVSAPLWRLRSRGDQHRPAQEGNVDPQPVQTPTASSRVQGVKRRRSKFQIDQQLPAKVSKLNDSQEASSVLSSDADCEGRAEGDEQVQPATDKQETETDGKSNHLPPQSEEQEQQEKAEIHQTNLSYNPEPGVIPSESANMVIPTQTDEVKTQQSVDVNSSEESQSKSPVNEPEQEEPAGADTVASSEQTPVPPVKTETVEIELDDFNSIPTSKSPESLQCSANTPPKSDCPNTEQNTFRRKRNGKRRRRISNVLLQREHVVENHENSSDTQQKTDCGDAQADPSVNTDQVIRTKRGTKTLLKCGYCGRTFKFLSQFVIHQRIHTGERPFKCSECGKAFSKNSNLNLHLKTHSKHNMYQKCPFCKIKFSSSEYASHMKLHEDEQAQDCKSNASEQQSRDGDNESSQGRQRNISPEKKDKKVCQYCGKTFPFQSALIRHVRVHTGEKPFKCDICGKAFGQAYFLRVHELTHWSVKRYNCTRCEKSFTHYSNAKNHTCRPADGGDEDLQPNKRVKPSLTYTCHICKNVFDHLQEFNSHMREHTGAKLYRCLYCDKLFGVLSEFNAHRGKCRAERNASSFSLNEEETMSLIQYTVPALRCSSGHNSASFPASNPEIAKKQSQIRHKKRPTNLKKPFQSTVIPAHHLSYLVSKLNKLDNRSDPRKYLCPRCGRLFRHMGRLRAHMLTHAAGQSYACACCGKTLQNWRKLWHHQRIHRQRRGRFTCPQCGKGFRFVEPYKRHMSEHPEFHWVQVRSKKVSLPYQCEQCRSSFRTLDLLFNHQLCHSSTEDDLFVIDHYTQSNMKMLGPPANTPMSHPAHEENSSPWSSLNSQPEPLQQELHPVSMISHNQGPNSANSSQQLSRTHSIQDREVSCDKIEENAPGKPLKPLRTVTKNASITNEKSTDGVKCAVCGSAYPAISDLYHHYLQHARGQV